MYYLYFIPLICVEVYPSTRINSELIHEGMCDTIGIVPRFCYNNNAVGSVHTVFSRSSLGWVEYRSESASDEMINIQK